MWYKVFTLYSILCRQVNYYLVQQSSWKVVPVDVGSPAHRSSRQNQRPHEGSLGFGIITGPGLHGLSHPLPLSEDGLTGSSPFPWPFETILVRSTGSEQHLQSQPGISQQQPGDVGSNPQQSCDLIHVVEIIDLDSVSLTGDIPEKKDW